MTSFVIGALGAAFVIALIALAAQRRICQRATEAALQHEERLLDRAHAAELRSSQQIDALLDRISTEPRLEVRPAPAPPADLSTRKYIADHPADDEAWNDYRTVSEDDTA